MKLFGTKITEDSMMLVTRIDPDGESIHAACHGECAERARKI